MLNITGGKVSYGRTVKTGDFENKRVDVELHFSVGEDEDSHEALMALAGQLAWKQCHEMLAMTKLPATIEGQAQPALVASPAAQAVEARKPGRPPKVALVAPAAPVPAPVAHKAPELSLPSEPVKIAPSHDDDLLGLGGETAPITDADLTKAIQDRQAVVKNGTAIRTLIASFIPKGQINSFKNIPADKRSEFVEALNSVPSL